MLERGRSDPGLAPELADRAERGQRSRARRPSIPCSRERRAAGRRGGDRSQVLASDSVRQLAGTIPGISFRDRVRVRLKAFDEPTRLYEVVSAERVAAKRTPWLQMNRRLALLAAVVVGAASTAVLVATVAMRDAGEPRGEAVPGPACGELSPRASGRTS